MSMKVLHPFSLCLSKRKLNCLAASLDSEVLEQWLCIFWEVQQLVQWLLPAFGSPGGISCFQAGFRMFSWCVSQPGFLLLLLLNWCYILFFFWVRHLCRVHQNFWPCRENPCADPCCGCWTSRVLSLLVCRSDTSGHIPQPELLCDAFPVNDGSCPARGQWGACGKQIKTTRHLGDVNCIPPTQGVVYHQGYCDPSALTYSPCQISWTVKEAPQHLREKPLTSGKKEAQGECLKKSLVSAVLKAELLPLVKQGKSILSIMLVRTC